MNQSKVIIYIDDDKDDQLLFTEGLNSCSEYEIICFNGGPEFLKVARTLHPKPSLVVCDMNMPAMNGLEVLQQLKQNDVLGDVPVVIFSTSSFHMDFAHPDTKKFRLIQKPFQFNEYERIGSELRDLMLS